MARRVLIATAAGAALLLSPGLVPWSPALAPVAAADDPSARELVDQAKKNLLDAERLTKGAETKVDGTDVIPLKGTSEGRRVVLYVTSDESLDVNKLQDELQNA